MRGRRGIRRFRERARRNVGEVQEVMSKYLCF